MTSHLRPRRRTRRWILIGVAVVATLVLGAPVLEMVVFNSVETTTFEVVGDQLFMIGEINSKTDDQFETIIAAHPEVTTLVFTVVPGSMDDETMFELGRRIRGLGLNTHLVEGGFLASGGVDLFLAGVERTMERDGSFWVHSWRGVFKEATEYPRDHDEHALNRDYIVDMGIPEEFYWFTINAAPADDVHRMTPEEVTRFGLLTQPIMDSTTNPPFEAEFRELLGEIDTP